MIKIKTMLSLALLSATIVPSSGVQISQGGIPQESAELEGREILFYSGNEDPMHIPENIKQMCKAELPKIMANIEAYKTKQPFFVLDADQYRVFYFSFDTANLKNQDEPVNVTTFVSTKSALWNEVYEQVNEYIEQGKHLRDGQKAADLNISEYYIGFANNKVSLILFNRILWNNQSIVLFDLKEKCGKLAYEFFKDKSNWKIWVRNLDRKSDIPEQSMLPKAIYIKDERDTLINYRFINPNTFKHFENISSYFKERFQVPVNKIIDIINNNYTPPCINDKVADYRLTKDEYSNSYTHRLTFTNITNGNNLQFVINIFNPSIDITIYDKNLITVGSQDELDRAIKNIENLKLQLRSVHRTDSEDTLRFRFRDMNETDIIQNIAYAIYIRCKKDLIVDDNGRHSLMIRGKYRTITN